MEAAVTGVPLARRTSFKIGGTAREYHAPDSIEALRGVLRELHARREPPFILGGGANTLFPDGEYARPVVSTERLRLLEVEDTSVFAECGVPLNVLISRSVHDGLGGLEGFAGIPGTAGGAVAMNAGGAGWSFGDRVRELGLLPLDGGPPVRVRGSEVSWGYRTANLKGFVVAWVALDLEPADRAEIRARAREFLRKKAARQPLGIPSAGCIFKNPAGGAAGKWIEDLGLKGLRSGGAKVSEVHANFIVNDTGSARAEDVLKLVGEVRSRVERTYGVTLETEIVLA
jgi:UDP-N-acetylmuramate dehydrogenase